MNALQDLFRTVLNMSLTASYVIVGVLLLRLMLKKAPKVFSYALWAAVLFRLVCPFSFTSAYSILGIMNSDVRYQTGMPDYMQQAIDLMPKTLQTGGNNIDYTIGTPLAPVALDTGINPIQMRATLFSLIWLAGVVVLLLVNMRSYMLLKRRLQTATLKSFGIYETDQIDTAFVLGLIQPRIYLPVGIGETELSHILAHERTHIRRRDHLIKPLAYLVLIVHWFNPLIWLAFMLMSQDMEMSCDESVLQAMGSQSRGSYSNSLLSLSVRQSRLVTITPLAFGESRVKARIRNILNYKRPTLWIIAVAVLIVGSATVALTANPQVALTEGSIANISWTAELSGDRQSHAVDQSEWLPIIKLINTARRSHLPTAYRPTYGEMYPVHYTLTVTTREQDPAESYTLMLYNHKDWDPFHGEYNYKLALAHSIAGKETKIWRLPYQACVQMMEWFRSNQTLADPTDSVAELVERNLVAILSSPLSSSNPQDYISAHQNEYESILKYGGEQALAYMLAQFESGDAAGLRGQIMMRLCKTLLGNRNNVTDDTLSPQEWYANLSIRQEVRLPDFAYEGSDPIAKLVYATEMARNSQPDRGFTIVAPHIFGSYTEGELLKVFVTTYSACYKLYGNVLDEVSGGIIPAAITYQKRTDGYTLIAYEQAKDGSLFAPSVRAFCTLPLSGKEIPGLAEQMLGHYGNYDDIRALHDQNLYLHLKKNNILDAKLINPYGEVKFSMDSPPRLP